MTRTTLVNCGRYGQLANRLFLSAHLLAAAIDNECRFINLVFEEFAEDFALTQEDMLCRFPAARSLLRHPKLRNQYCKVLRLLLPCIEKTAIGNKFIARLTLGSLDEFYNLNDPAFKSLVREKAYILLDGWRFRDFHSFEKYQDQIRAYFKPGREIQSRADQLVGSFRSEVDVVVGVHIRHGDYKTHFSGRHYYSLERYRTLLLSCEELFPQQRVGFIVCSDEQQPAAAFSEYRYVFARGRAVEDLYTLAACDYLIGPPSTYSMWASFYGKCPLYVIENESSQPKLDDFSIRNYTKEVEDRYFFSD